MPNKMLIDSSHPEETRVVVTRGNRIEEFDFESQDKKQLKGNIYLARVTRVEPSLQAAFVEYGGNRHGFLAFSEIHPDYYQIPMADRQALLRAEAEAAESEDDDDEAEERGERRGRRRRRGRGRDREERQASSETAEADAEAADEASAPAGSISDDETHLSAGDEPAEQDDATEENAQHADAEQVEEAVAAGDADDAASGDETSADEPDETKSGRPSSMAASIDADVISSPIPEPEAEDGAAPEESKASDEHAEGDEQAASEERVGPDNGGVEEVSSSHGEDNEVESVGAEDALEEIRSSRRPMRRNYKIQEVIKRRQILLVQVVKEERGNKGAALTTYLSLAGRYSVLMPNTARGGGISRKITNAQDRKRLKEVVADLDVPQGMGVILRTAGESRTKAEIKRDYEYLMRLWENVRTLTLQSTAPALVYEEGSLIKRSVRDLYNKDIDEILVAGEDGYREAKDFMRMLMPSHAKVVQPYRDSVPIFARSGIEAQLDRMLQPQVTLKSGGYIIINQTEALVSIDVNSGRSTREHSIEDTALQTNLEAAEEVARQLRLRDLAGLIVIDFIDMEENRNNRSVEKRLKDCLKNDRARIQVGRISHFGLLEMSRQRIRASVLESTMKPCPHCGGTGHVRSDSSVALHVVRAIEEFLLKDARNHITVKTPAVTALYVLNHKRSTLVEMEKRFGVAITIEADETLGAQPYLIVRGAVAEKPVAAPDTQPAPAAIVEQEDEIEVEIADEAEEEAVEQTRSEHHGQGDHDRDRDRKRRRRRRRRGGRDHEHGSDHEHSDEHRHEGHASAQDSAPDKAATDGEESTEDGDRAAPADADGDRKKRRRGKRGGRRNRNEAGAEVQAEGAAEPAGGAEAEHEGDGSSAEAAGRPAELMTEASIEAEMIAEEPAPETSSRRSRRSEPAEEAPAAADEPAINGADVAAETGESGSRVHRTRRREGADAPPSEPMVVSNVETAGSEAKPRKGGWWQRKGFF